MKPQHLLFLFVSLLFLQCKNPKEDRALSQVGGGSSLLVEQPEGLNAPEEMVWVPGGTFMQGAVKGDEMALEHEKPAHPVAVDGFFMDATEVTNAQFRKFVQETGYVTVAEREIDWEEMKKQLPPGTPKPHDSILQPGSLVFRKTEKPVPNLYDFSQWWEWKIGANWKHPSGPGSDLQSKEEHPVVHIAYEDAVAYSEWAGRQLPTEAQWEYAARGGKKDTRFGWGNEKQKLPQMANTWEGNFPNENTRQDGFENRAPVASYPPNGFGLHDMAGNVWEFTRDWYNTNYYANLLEDERMARNPEGAETAYNPHNRGVPEKVIKGGSFLCHVSYCASFRVSARMQNSLDSSHEHLGFRTIATPEMLSEEKE